jgi:Uma2 family endonuclease
MATATELLTVAQFRELKEPAGVYYELRHGEVVPMTRPKWKHGQIQERLRELIRVRNQAKGIVRIEFAYRPLPEHELWVADVAYARRERCHIADDDNFAGAPDLVIEVLSPSNTAEELDEKSVLCLENGTLEFWVVSPKLKAVTVYTAHTRAVYRSGDAVPVDRFFPGQPAISVSEIFTDPEM